MGRPEITTQLWEYRKGPYGNFKVFSSGSNVNFYSTNSVVGPSCKKRVESYLTSTTHRFLRFKTADTVEYELSLENSCFHALNKYLNRL